VAYRRHRCCEQPVGGDAAGGGLLCYGMQPIQSWECSQHVPGVDGLCPLQDTGAGRQWVLLVGLAEAPDCGLASTF
jgi:hypothetical protein